MSLTESTAFHPEGDLPLYGALDRMEQHEADLDDPDYDPAKDVGEIDMTKANVRRKIDAIEARLLAFKCGHAKWAKLAEFYATRARGAKNNRERLKAYVRDQLASRGYQKIQGNDYEVRLTRNPSPSLILKREDATAEDMIAFGPSFVTHVPERYEWNDDVIEKTLVDAEKVARLNHPDGVRPRLPLDEVASIEYGQHVRFWPAKVEAVREPKKPRAKRSDKGVAK